MRLKLIFFTFLCLQTLSASFLFGQGEGNIWYFGDFAGLDFNGGAPTALGNSAMITQEGCATISDMNGNLLFYTDGSNVFNRNHVTMPNGTGLMGNASSTQSGVIVPRPGNPAEFFIFTVDNLAGPDGLRYSVVDMSLNGGMGDVTTRNVALLTPSTEKITSVQHQNRLDLWVVGHEWNSNAFYAWRVTTAGVDPVPVISNVGPVHTGIVDNTLGYLKASSGGDKIAQAAMIDGRFEVYDFDNSTGVVSNAVELNDPSYATAYGVEFSPDGTLLYGTRLSSFGGNPPSIFQWDLTAGNQAAIQASGTVVGTSNSSEIGALQLGPDAKIYLSRSNSSRLGIIDDPNQLGIAAAYNDNGPSLGGRIGRLGLPTFIQSFFTIPRIVSNDTCLGFVSDFSLTSTVGIDSVNWNFGDPGSGANNTSTLLAPVHTFSDSGTFFIQCIYHFGVLQDTLFDTLTITMDARVDLGPDRVICDGNPVLLDATFPGATYLWSDGSTGPTLTVNVDGEYWVELSNSCGMDQDTISFVFSDNPSLNFGPDRNLCEGESFFLDATNPDASYIWQDGSTQPDYVVTQTGQYYVDVVNPCGIRTDTIDFLFSPNPVVNLAEDTSACRGDPVTLDAGAGFAEYRWQHGPSDQTVEVFDERTYRVTVRDTNGCEGVGEISLFHETCLYGLYIPSGFTPNGDGINDFFFATENNVTLTRLRIYSRWGQLIYQFDSASDTWDGTIDGQPIQEGVFTWVAEAVDFRNEKFTKQGTITLIR